MEASDCSSLASRVCRAVDGGKIRGETAVVDLQRRGWMFYLCARGVAACNRTLYGDVGRTYRVEVRRPREDRLPFLCHLNFTAAGSDLGDLVQVGGARQHAIESRPGRKMISYNNLQINFFRTTSTKNNISINANTNGLALERNFSQLSGVYLNAIQAKTNDKFITS